MVNLSKTNKTEERLWFFRRPIQFLADVAILCAAFFLAYLFRFEFSLSEYYFDNALNQLPFVVFVQFAALFLVGGYSIIWRYVSLEDIKAFLKAAVASGVILILVRLLLSPEGFIRWQVPLSIILMDTIFAFSGLLALRVMRRFSYEVGEKRQFFSKNRELRAKRLCLSARAESVLRLPKKSSDAPMRNCRSEVLLTMTGEKKAAA